MTKRKPKPCKLCGRNEAVVPDRDAPGRPVKAICRRCHGAGLAADFERALGGVTETRRELGIGVEDGDKEA